MRSFLPAHTQGTTDTGAMLPVRLLALCSLGVLLLIPGVLYSQTSAAKPSTSPPATSSPSGAEYVGADTCKGCHEEIYAKHFVGTPHFALTKRAGNHGCEDCHGPGSAHVQGGGDVSKIITFKGMAVADSSKVCLKCHSGDPDRANYLRSSHFTNQVGCLDCHSPHNAKVERSLLRAPQTQLCYGCHTEVKAEFARPFRHRVNEGLIQCNDCHNAHGGFLPRQLRTSATQQQICTKCHTETKGPFTYEHIPVRTEGCVSCHMPHGSMNARLLKVSQVNILCLQCHTLAMSDVPSQPPIGPAHNQAQKYQACTMCHSFIHGSNFSEVFFKP